VERGEGRHINRQQTALAKTTTLRTIMGLLVPRGWADSVRGAAYRRSGDRIGIVRLGIAQSPEGRRIFSNAMSVLENLEMGAFARAVTGNRSCLIWEPRWFDAFSLRLRERLRQTGWDVVRLVSNKWFGHGGVLLMGTPQSVVAG